MIEHTTVGSVWATWCTLDDVYYRWEHLEVWGREWQIAPLGVRYQDPGGTVLLPLLRAPLDALPGGEEYCDLRTAYDFGGPCVVGSPDLARFETQLAIWLQEQRCVTLFMRIHPFHAEVLADAVLHTDNHVVDLSGGMEAVRAGYYGSWRRDRNKAERQGCTTTVEMDVALFCRLYDTTMARVGAPPWYRFSRTCLEELIGLTDVDQLITRGPDSTPVATALSLRSGEVRFYHLSAAEPATGLLSTHHLLDALIAHASDEGCRFVHLGGGAPSLRRFKSRVGNATVPYRVVKRVVNPAAYDRLCKETGCSGPAFPAYLGWTP